MKLPHDYSYPMAGQTQVNNKDLNLCYWLLISRCHHLHLQMWIERVADALETVWHSSLVFLVWALCENHWGFGQWVHILGIYLILLMLTHKFLHFQQKFYTELLHKYRKMSWGQSVCFHWFSSFWQNLLSLLWRLLHPLHWCSSWQCCCQYYSV